MEFPKPYIDPKRFTAEATIVSMRMPKDMIQEFDNIVAATGRTRNEGTMLCSEFALGHMEITGTINDKQGIIGEGLTFVAGAKANTRKS